MFEWLIRLFKSVEKNASVSMHLDRIGTVTHYFPKCKVAVIKVEKGKIKQGDRLLFKGHTTDFKQAIDSLEVDHKTIDEVGRGGEVGIKVKARVRPNDLVFRG